MYELELKDGPAVVEARVTADGALQLIEQHVPPKDLPKAVADAVAGKFPKSTVTHVHLVTKFKGGKEQAPYYEVELTTAHKKTYEAEVAADGTILDSEEKTPGK